MGALVVVYVSLATVAMASRSQSSADGNVKVPIRQPPAPHYFGKLALTMVPSG